jgi:hypothetical protein
MMTATNPTPLELAKRILEGKLPLRYPPDFLGAYKVLEVRELAREVVRLSEELSVADKKLNEIVDYASDNANIMWAAIVIGIAAGCDFKDAPKYAFEQTLKPVGPFPPTTKPEGEET